MSSAIRIRLAELADVQAIVDFQVAMAQESEELVLDRSVVARGVTAVLENPTLGHYWIAVADTADDGSRRVGCALITFEWSDWRARNVWWFQSVYVHPSMRGAGVFRAMFDHVKALALADTGIGGLRLYVDRRNKSAQQVYRKIGMTDEHYMLFEWMKPT